jgi:hypothetical protein
MLQNKSLIIPKSNKTIYPALIKLKSTFLVLKNLNKKNNYLKIMLLYK